MAKKKTVINAYRFYNFVIDKYGEPFGLCDKHHLTAPVPGNCILDKIGDNTELTCDFCLQEVTNPKPEEQ